MDQQSTSALSALSAATPRCDVPVTRRGGVAQAGASKPLVGKWSALQLLGVIAVAILTSNLITLTAAGLGVHMTTAMIAALHLVLSIGLIFASLYLVAFGPMQRRLGELERENAQLLRSGAELQRRVEEADAQSDLAHTQLEAVTALLQTSHAEIARTREDAERTLAERTREWQRRVQALEAKLEEASAPAVQASEAGQTNSDVPQGSPPLPAATSVRSADEIHPELRQEIAGQALEGLAEEVKNAIAPILLSLDILRNKPLDPESQAAVSTIECSAEYTGDLLKQTLHSLHGTDGERLPLLIQNLVQEVIGIAREMFPRAIQILADVPADLWPVKANATQLRQAVLKLCVRARDAMPTGGVLRLSAQVLAVEGGESATRLPLPAGEYIVLRVQDSGAGLPSDIRERLSEPAPSDQDPVPGTELGISVVLATVRKHGGWMEVKDAPEGGSVISIFLPAERGSVFGTTVVAQPELAPGNGELILLADEDAGSREVTRLVLSRAGYEVIPAIDGLEALGIIAQRLGKLRVILTNIGLPGMDGPSLARSARKMDPAIRIIGASALGKTALQAEKLAALQSLGISQLLTKPISSHDLLKAVDDELRRGVDEV